MILFSYGRRLLAPILILFGLGIIWHFMVQFFALPAYILPGPLPVLFALKENISLLLPHTGITIAEILLGLFFGILLGSSTALLLAYYRPVRQWLLPILVISQALPVFALAPLLVLWFGYGLASKVVMATLIIYFPVTSAFYDGLRHSRSAYRDMGHVMNANKINLLRFVFIPAALPKFASGLRVATVTAPIGAIVGEWVGASQGLGFLMLHANARMQIDLMFAALFIIACFAVLFYYLVDHILTALTRYHHD